MLGREGREVLWFLLLCRACGNVPSIRSQEMERYRCFKGDTLEDLSCSLAGRIQKCYSNCYFSPFNVEILKMLTFQWTATVFFDHLNGILQNQTWLFTSIGIVVGIAIIVYVRYLPTDQRLIRYLLGLQLGGATGNLIDRLIVNTEPGSGGYVTDFVKMGIPDVYYWPNYNIADSAIVIGVIGLAIFVILDDIRQQRERKALEHATNDA